MNAGRLRMAALAGAAAVLGGCRGEPSQPAQAALPPPPATFEVALHDYRFELTGTVPAGRVVFRVRNVGRVAHNLVLLALAESIPPIDEQLRGDSRELVTPFAGARPRDPQTEGSFAVELVEGQRYAMICTLLDPERRSHALKGMNAEFRAGHPGITFPSTSSETTAPAALVERR